MLTATTKNRINTCRDILVGKIPDPKGQIDQITNALVYKFMDDQDRMSRELGYDPSFFIGDYEQYAWSKLFDTKLTNQNRANLYIEGLDRLSRADHLPELFKQIFKDAYLPFRDANTIVMFLTEINGFDYHHSEELGNAFEYLLSIMGSQGDAGQFRTPRHIIEFIVDVVNPEKTETILDPACGTAGFLVEAFKHISENGDLEVKDITKLSQSITGVDIDPGMAKIARVNLYLHGFKTPKITENDTLTNERLWGQKYDVILANPPFMTPKGGIIPHNKFVCQSKRAEILFVEYILEHLKLNGKGAIIVPDGVISTDGIANNYVKKLLIEKGLYAVVSLHQDVFKPYAGVKTSVLFFDRKLSSRNSILFGIVENDGYSRGETRVEIKENDLLNLKENILKFKKNENEVINNLHIRIEPKKSIFETKSTDLFPNFWINKNYEDIAKFPLDKIESIFNIEKGSLQSTKRSEGIYPFLTGSKDWLDHEAYSHDMEALVFVMGAGGSLGRVHYINGKFITSDLCFILTPKEKYKSINLKFYQYYLNSLRERIVFCCARGTGKLSINETNFSNFMLPIPPKDVENQLQDVIAGSEKQILNLRNEANLIELNMYKILANYF